MNQCTCPHDPQNERRGAALFARSTKYRLSHCPVYRNEQCTKAPREVYIHQSPFSERTGYITPKGASTIALFLIDSRSCEIHTQSKPKRQVNALSLCVRRPDSAAAETASFQFDATNIHINSEMAKEIGRKMAFYLQISRKTNKIFVFSVILCTFAAEIIHNGYECNCN